MKKIPIRVVIHNILPYHIVNLDEQMPDLFNKKEVGRYFGYFKRDVTRKIFMVFRWEFIVVDSMQGYVIGRNERGMTSLTVVFKE